MMQRVQNGFRSLSGRLLMRGFASSLLEGWEQLLFIPDSRSLGGWLLMDELDADGRFDTLVQASMKSDS